MTKFNQWLLRHPEVRAGLRVAMYSFVATFSMSLLGFLGDVQEWATNDDVVFPAIAPLGKAAAAAASSALAGLLGYAYNKLPSTTTAAYPRK